MFNRFTAYRQQWFAGAATARADILAGIVVALALIPEAIGFSIIAGVDPRVGLYASIAIAIVISFTGGRPGMISAATAAVAVLVIPLVREHGVEYLFAATILMGVIQIIAGLLRLDLVMQFVSRSVITGFVNALAILIFMAQLPQLIDVTWQAYAMVAGGLAIIYLLPLLTKAVPSPLIAILILSAISIGFGLPVNTVGDMGKLPEGLPSIVLPDVPLTSETLRIILPYSLTMVAVGLLESLLTAQIVDDMTHSDSDKRRECAGQGTANIAAACLARPLCRPHADARAGRGDDHGVDRHLQLELDREPAPPSADLVDRNGDHGCCGRGDTRPVLGRARGRAAVGDILCRKSATDVRSAARGQ